MADHEGDSDAVAVVPVETAQEPFTYKGGCTDEVTLKFDDGQELFVSENLMWYASPVFCEMLKGAQDKVMELKGRSYADVLVFLRTIHPGLEEKVTDSNVFVVVELAEMFDVKRLIMTCKDCLVDMMKSATEILQEQDFVSSSSSISSELSRTEAVTTFFTILLTATRYNYGDIEDTAASAIARVSCNIYMGEMINAEVKSNTTISGYLCEERYKVGSYHVSGAKQLVSERNKVGSYNHVSGAAAKQLVSERNKLRQLYSSLPGSTQLKIVSKRLVKIEKNEFL